MHRSSSNGPRSTDHSPRIVRSLLVYGVLLDRRVMLIKLAQHTHNLRLTIPSVTKLFINTSSPQLEPGTWQPKKSPRVIITLNNNPISPAYSPEPRTRYPTKSSRVVAHHQQALSIRGLSSGPWTQPWTVDCGPWTIMCIFTSATRMKIPLRVFFDDFRVEHIKSPVVQMDEYYPFGLTFNSYKRENSLENKIKFQGQEHVKASPC